MKDKLLYTFLILAIIDVVWSLNFRRIQWRDHQKFQREMAKILISSRQVISERQGNEEPSH